MEENSEALRPQRAVEPVKKKKSLNSKVKQTKMKYVMLKK